MNIRCWVGVGLLLLSAALAQAQVNAPAVPASTPAADVAAPASLSLSARKVYEQARSQLVQIRTVLKEIGRAHV